MFLLLLLAANIIIYCAAVQLFSSLVLRIELKLTFWLVLVFRWKFVSCLKIVQFGAIIQRFVILLLPFTAEDLLFSTVAFFVSLLRFVSTFVIIVK